MKRDQVSRAGMEEKKTMGSVSKEKKKHLELGQEGKKTRSGKKTNDLGRHRSRTRRKEGPSVRKIPARLRWLNCGGRT